jgi:hypothetical protein
MTVARVFKSAWFAKAARRNKISDAELCKAIAQVLAGQADDLGGGVYKKRLSNNQYRSIILARGGDWWVYEYLFAKQDQANIEADELKRLKQIAQAYARLTTDQVAVLIAEKDWVEICVDHLEQKA